MNDHSLGCVKRIAKEIGHAPEECTCGFDDAQALGDKLEREAAKTRAVTAELRARSPVPSAPSDPLQCPFCGSEPHVTEITSQSEPWWVSCGYEGCEVKPCIRGARLTRAEAITAWNNRARGGSPSAPAEPPDNRALVRDTWAAGYKAGQVSGVPLAGSVAEAIAGLNVVRLLADAGYTPDALVEDFVPRFKAALLKALSQQETPE